MKQSNQENPSFPQRQELIQKIQGRMSQKRWQHVLGVEETAIALAKRYHGDVLKAQIAALVHDYAKERSDAEFQTVIQTQNFDLALLDWNNAIWHGIVGTYFIQKELGIVDPDILQAVAYHTTGAAEMTLLDKIIYVADYIEPGRDFPGVDQARQLAKLDLDQAVSLATKQTLKHLIAKEQSIYPKTIETYNRWVAKFQGGDSHR